GRPEKPVTKINKL
nr:hypothetical protein [Tanacetum cinerariifolium]